MESSVTQLYSLGLSLGWGQGIFQSQGYRDSFLLVAPPWGNECVPEGIGLCVLGNPSSGVFLHCLFKDAFPPSSGAGGRWDLGSVLTIPKVPPGVSPDWQQGGPASRLRIGREVLQTGGRTLDCSTFTVPAVGRRMLSLSLSLSLSPSLSPVLGTAAFSLSQLFPRSLWCPGGGDRQDPRQVLGPLSATALQPPGSVCTQGRGRVAFSAPRMEDGQGLLTKACSDRIRGNGFKLTEGLD